MARMTKSIAFTAPGVAEYIDTPIMGYDIDADDAVVVRNFITTISCGTERANLMGHPNVAGGSKIDPDKYFPRFLGYSSAGIVEEVGNAVKSVKPGDRVATSWGIHAQTHVFEERNVTKLPDNVSFEQGALCHIATFPMAGIRKTRLELGESAMTVGLGILGMFSVIFMKAAGAYPVIAVDTNSERRAFAEKLGADFSLDPTKPDFEQKVLEITDGRKINAAVEVTGNGPALDRLLDVMAPYGRIALLGCTRDSDFTIDYYKKIHCPGITLIGAHTNARPRFESHGGWWTEKEDRLTALRLISAGRIDLSEFVCETHSPVEAPQVYARLANDKNFPVCIQFDWRNI